MATYTQIVNEFEAELDENTRSRYEEGMTYDEFETEYDEFVLYHYNTHPMTQYECVAIVGNNLQIYLEMEKIAREYHQELTGEPYDKSGMENIIALWRVYMCDNWKHLHFETTYEILVGNEDEDGNEIPQEDPLTRQQ